MIRNSILLKSIACFLAMEMLISTLAPVVSWALTAGPTAPEATSFEPVDTTEMVNLATGELVYNLPLLDVPGPGGGYPINLSYHAGIRMDQEASWVGLGFTLNVGAINRSVNGYADDNFNSKHEVKDYWGGGETTTRTFTLGLSIPISGQSNQIGANATLAIANDTYKGTSYRWSHGVSFMGFNAYANEKNEMTTGFDAGATAVGLTGSSSATGVYSSVSRLAGATTMDFTISSNGIKTSISVAGNSSVANNGGAGNISRFTETTRNEGIPLLSFGTLGFKDYLTRYWSDESASLYSFGSLYPGEGNKKIDGDYYTDDPDTEFISYAFDSYDLYDGSALETTTAYPDDLSPAKKIGGTLPAYDRFDVLGQGVGGVMQPFIFENGDLWGQNIYERSPVGKPMKYYPVLRYKSMRPFSDRKVDFRFLNDFSNSLSVSDVAFSDNGSTVGPHTITAPTEGFNNSSTSQKLAGSRHIEWFTNEEIATGTARTAGFIDAYTTPEQRPLSMPVYRNYLQPEACYPISATFAHGKGDGSYKTDRYAEDNRYTNLYGIMFPSLKPRNVDLRKKIGGFMVTNESGVTYHYAQPVYNYNEYTRSKRKNPHKGASTFRETKNDEPYAYTWLLTAITGPDFVDRGGANGEGNGIVDDGDWGYWVKFEYGQWTNAYQWRTPHTGYVSDLEDEYESFAYGIKELYYLDAVETQTHKAIFVKSKRKDARGVTSRLEGGSNPRQYTLEYHWGTPSQKGEMNFSVSPVSMMKLDRICLFDKKTLQTLGFDKSKGDKHNTAPKSNPHKFYYKGDRYEYTLAYTRDKEKIIIDENEDFIPVSYHNGDAVYDEDDVEKTANFKENALRTIVLNTDYSLTPGVPNSIGYFEDVMDPHVTCQSRLGNGCDAAKMDFDFEWPWPIPNGCSDPVRGPYGVPFCCDISAGLGYTADRDAFYSVLPLRSFLAGQCVGVNDPYAGSNVAYLRSGKLTLKSISFLGKGGVGLIPPTRFSYNHNPAYDHNKYNSWGYYSSDIENGQPDYTRQITASSAGDMAAWSLESIKTPLGAIIRVEYEPNDYGHSVYNDFSVFSISAAEVADRDRVTLTLKEKGVDMEKWFRLNQSIDLKALIVYDTKSDYRPYSENFQSRSSDKITRLEQDKITVDCPRLYEMLKRNKIFLRREDCSGLCADGEYDVVPYFIAGVINIPDPADVKYAGGVRVGRLGIENLGQLQSATRFTYKVPDTGMSSGVTSYKPFSQPTVEYPSGNEFFDAIHADDDKRAQRRKLDSYRFGFQKKINELFENILVFTREVPSPGSLYEYVKVQNEYNGMPDDAYTVYHFRPFDAGMVSRQITDDRNSRRHVTLINTAIDVGNILEEKRYDNTGVLLASTQYGYLYGDEDQPFEQDARLAKQGFVSQAFHKHIGIKQFKIDIDYGDIFKPTETTVYEEFAADRAVITKRMDRSNAVTSVVQRDHKGQTTGRTENRVFDFYTGKPLKVATKDGFSNEYITTTEPAYQVQRADGSKPYEAMGLKVYNVHHRHMLTQEATSSAYKVDPADNARRIGLVSASVQTWSDQVPTLQAGAAAQPQAGIWRKQATYSFVGRSDDQLQPDGLLPPTAITYFTAWRPEDATPDGWQKNTTITAYDVSSHAVETRDITGNYTTILYTPDRANIQAVASPASLRQFVYDGAEGSVPPPGIEYGQGGTTDNAHTGMKGVLGVLGSFALKYKTVPGAQAYSVSVWATRPDASIKFKIGSTREVTAAVQRLGQSGSWYLLSASISVGRATDPLEVWCVANNAPTTFDDFRIHPSNSILTGYVYNRWGELSHILDNNNLYTEFRYDAAGRLIETHRETLKEGVRKINEITYHHAQH